MKAKERINLGLAKKSGTAIAVYALALMVFAVGCNNKSGGGGGGGGTPAPTVLPPGAAALVCNGCPANPVNLLTAVQSSVSYGNSYSPTFGSSGPMNMNFNVVGDRSKVGGNNTIVTQDDAPITRYYGPVAFQGTLTVTAADANLCNAPVGTYDLSALQAGQSSAAMVSTMKLGAQLRGGGTQIVFDIMNITFTSSMGGNLAAASTGIRMVGNMTVSTVNGAPCQRSVQML